MKQVAVVGSGVVGETLANGFLKHGYEVMRASRNPAQLREWKETAGPTGLTGTFSEAATWADTVVLAVRGTAGISAVDHWLADRVAVSEKRHQQQEEEEKIRQRAVLWSSPNPVTARALHKGEVVRWGRR